MKGRIIGYNGEKNEITVFLPFTPKIIRLNEEVEIEGVE